MQDTISFHKAIKEKIVSLAQALGKDATCLADDELISESGGLDSASLLEFVIWIEDYFRIVIEAEDMTIEALGTISNVVDTVAKKS